MKLHFERYFFHHQTKSNGLMGEASIEKVPLDGRSCSWNAASLNRLVDDVKNLIVLWTLSRQAKIFLHEGLYLERSGTGCKKFQNMHSKLLLSNLRFFTYFTIGQTLLQLIDYSVQNIFEKFSVFFFISL